MLDKIKGFGEQISNFASGAVDGVTSTVKEGASAVKDGAHAVADKATGAVSAAGQRVAEKAGQINDKVSDMATREAVAQLREVMAVAVEELRNKPISTSPVLLIAKVDIVLASLEIQMMVDHNTQLLHLPSASRKAAEQGPEPDKPEAPAA